MSNPNISIVVPLLDEAGNVAQLHQEIVSAMQKIGKSFEVIYVNDGSTDNTKGELSLLQDCVVIEMRRSFGQTAGLVAGFEYAKGELIATLDGDLQNNPNDLIEMYNLLLDVDVDMVIGWRKVRNDNLSKKIPSKIAYMLRQILLGDSIHDAGCGIKMMRREVLDSLELYGEMHRFIASIAQGKGFLVKEMVVDHRMRTNGRTKYNIVRGVKGFLDMLSVWFWGKYTARPMHVLGGMGLFLILAGVFTLIVSFTHVFIDFGLLQTQQWIIFAFLEIILGLQMIISGFIVDVAVRGYFASSKKKSYEIRSIMNL